MGYTTIERRQYTHELTRPAPLVLQPEFTPATSVLLSQKFDVLQPNYFPGSNERRRELYLLKGVLAKSYDHDRDSFRLESGTLNVLLEYLFQNYQHADERLPKRFLIERALPDLARKRQLYHHIDGLLCIMTQQVSRETVNDALKFRRHNTQDFRNRILPLFKKIQTLPLPEPLWLGTAEAIQDRYEYLWNFVTNIDWVRNISSTVNDYGTIAALCHAWAHASLSNHPQEQVFFANNLVEGKDLVGFHTRHAVQTNIEVNAGFNFTGGFFLSNNLDDVTFHYGDIGEKMNVQVGEVIPEPAFLNIDNPNIYTTILYRQLQLNGLIGIAMLSNIFKQGPKTVVDGQYTGKLGFGDTTIYPSSVCLRLLNIESGEFDVSVWPFRNTDIVDGLSFLQDWLIPHVREILDLNI